MTAAGSHVLIIGAGTPVRTAVLAVAPASRFRKVTALIAVDIGSLMVPLIVRI